MQNQELKGDKDLRESLVSPEMTGLTERTVLTEILVLKVLREKLASGVTKANRVHKAKKHPQVLKAWQVTKGTLE